MGLQLDLFPLRVCVRLARRIAKSATEARWRYESLVGTVVRRWPGIALILFDGKKRDGSARGCLSQVPIVLPSPEALAPGEFLRSAMTEGRRRRG